MSKFDIEAKQNGVSTVESVAMLFLLGCVLVAFWKYIPSSPVSTIVTATQKLFGKSLADQHKQCMDDFVQKTAGSSADEDKLKEQNVDYVKICMGRAGFKIDESLLAERFRERTKGIRETYHDWIEEGKKDTTPFGVSMLEYKKSSADLQVAISNNKIKVSCYLDASLWCWQK